MGVGDDQSGAAQAAPAQGAEAVGPDGLGLGVADGHAQDFTFAVQIDADRDGDGLGDDAPGVAHPNVGGVEPDVVPFALDRAGEAGVDALVVLGAEVGDLILADAREAHGLHLVIDGVGEDARDIGLFDHRGEAFSAVRRGSRRLDK